MIAFDHVSVKDKTRLKVDSVTFSVEAGEVLGITGPIGAGKSALLRTVNGLVTPSSGVVKVEDEAVAGLSEKKLRALRRKAPMVFAKPEFMPRKTVFENLALPLKGIPPEESATPEARVTSAMAFAGIAGLEKEYPPNLSGELSHRAAIARALVLRPDILLCDELPSTLEPEETDGILDLLLRVNQEMGITLLLTTPDLNVVKKICHRTAIMQGGRLIELDDTYSLFSDPKAPFTRAYVAQQLPFDLPREVMDHAYGTIVRIEYRGDAANAPVLYEVSQRFGVEYNILQGRIEYIGGKALGKMYVSFSSEPALIPLVLDYLKENVSHAEVVQYA